MCNRTGLAPGVHSPADPPQSDVDLPDGRIGERRVPTGIGLAAKHLPIGGYVQFDS